MASSLFSSLDNAARSIPDRSLISARLSRRRTRSALSAVSTCRSGVPSCLRSSSLSRARCRISGNSAAIETVFRSDEFALHLSRLCKPSYHGPLPCYSSTSFQMMFTYAISRSLHVALKHNTIRHKSIFYQRSGFRLAGTRRQA